MAVNGSSILFMVNTGTEATPIYTPLAGQRDATFRRTAESIDASSKDQKARRVLSGRRTETVELTALFIRAQLAYQVLLNAYKAGLPVTIGREEFGDVIETASVYITDMSETAPDQGVAEVTMTAELDGDWTAA